MSIANRSRLRALNFGLLTALLAVACDQLNPTKAVSAGGVISVSITPSNVQVAVGQTTQLQAVIVGDSTQGVRWRAGNPAIATVDSTGLVQGVSLGSTTVIAIAVADTTKRGAATVTVVTGTAAVAPRP